MKKFRQLLKEAMANKTLYFCFGRFDIPTIGHSYLFKVLGVEANINGTDDWLIFPSRTTDYKKTFLDIEDRIKFLRELNPKIRNRIIDDPECRTIIDIMEKYKKKGFNKYVLIVGNSDVEAMERLKRHIPEDTTLEIPYIEQLKRNDSDTIHGISSSKLKKALISDDKKTFILGIGNEKIADEIWNILEPYNKHIEKYVKAKDKLK